MGPGTVAYRPVRSPGGLFIGDAHACQGDGEVCGVAVEDLTTTTISVDLIKKWAIEWSRLEANDFIMAIGSTRPLEDAARFAHQELIRRKEVDCGFDQPSRAGAHKLCEGVRNPCWRRQRNHTIVAYVRCAPLAEIVTFTTRFQQRHAARLN